MKTPEFLFSSCEFLVAVTLCHNPSKNSANELIQTSLSFKTSINCHTLSSLRLDWQMREDESFLTLQILFSQLIYVIPQVNKNSTILKSNLKGRIRPNGLKVVQREYNVTNILFLLKTK